MRTNPKNFYQITVFPAFIKKLFRYKISIPKLTNLMPRDLKKSRASILISAKDVCETESKINS